MRTSILLIILALLNISQASCQPGKPKSNDLKTLTDHFEVTLSFYKRLRADSIKIVKKYGDNGIYKITWSSDTQNTMDNPKVMVANKYGLQWRFDLAEMDKKMPFFQRLVKPLDTVKANLNPYHTRGNQFVSGRYILNFQDDTLLMQVDRSSGVSYVYKLTDSLIKAAMYLHYGRNDEYEMSEKLRLGTSILFYRQYADLQVFGDTISVLADITVTEIDSQTNTDTRLTQYMFRYKNGKLLAILPIVHRGYVDGTYYVIGDNFMSYKNSIYLQAGNTKIGTNNKIFAEFRLQDGMYKYHQLLNDTLPAENLKYGFYYHATDTRKDFPYYIMMTATGIRNILTGKEYNLSNLYTTVLDNKTTLTAKMMKHAVFDFKIDKSFTAYLTILDDEHFYYVRYDLERNTVIERKKLWAPGSARSYPSLDNWDYNYIFYWEENCIIRQKM